MRLLVSAVKKINNQYIYAFGRFLEEIPTWKYALFWVFFPPITLVRGLQTLLVETAAIVAMFSATALNRFIESVRRYEDWNGPLGKSQHWLIEYKKEKLYSYIEEFENSFK